MNANLQSLYDQAQFCGDRYANPEELAEQLARLVIEECCRIVQPSQHHQAWAQSYLGGVDGLELLESRVRALREHFGVEE